MVAVPEIDSSIREMVDTIVREFHPLQVILFGSRARGDHRPDSDTDLLVVLPRVEDKSAMRDEIRRSLHAPGITDIHVTDVAEVARRGGLVGPILRPALTEGLVLYEGGDLPTPLGVTETVKNEEVSDWLLWARGDLRSARILFDDDEPLFGNSCYHSQQAVEKALKAAQVFAQADFPRTHQLADLSVLLADPLLPADKDELDNLNARAVEGRYPGVLTHHDAAEIALNLATNVVAYIEATLKSKGLGAENRET